MVTTENWYAQIRFALQIAKIPVIVECSNEALLPGKQTQEKSQKPPPFLISVELLQNKLREMGEKRKEREQAHEPCNPPPLPLHPPPPRKNKKKEIKMELCNYDK